MSSLIKGPLDGAAAVRELTGRTSEETARRKVGVLHWRSFALTIGCGNQGDRGPRPPSRDPLGAIDAAADGQHARAVAGLVAAAMGLHVDEVLVLTRIAAGRPLGLTWGAWRPPPRKRLNVTSTARLPGAGKIHLTIDLDADGQPCAVWVEVHKEGSIVRGMLDCVAALASQALQHGASIHEVAGRMIGVRFEPDGAVEGHETVTRCLSIVDLLGQMIAAEFPAADAVLADEAARRTGGGK